MKTGFVGLGKLGLPCALSIENKGHEVCGYDINPEVKNYLMNKWIPYEEEGTLELLEKSNIQWKNSIKEVVESSDIVFCPVQTPHSEKYEGITRIPDERVDFEYKYLVAAIAEISAWATTLQKKITLIIISTVLPGTINREIYPVISSEYIDLCYNPFFIAMGTTRADFENPEFVLLGCDSGEEIVEMVSNFYHTIHSKPVFPTTIKNAELIKVIYNTFISSKIAFINTAMEICEKIGADIDTVSDALSLATDRIISTKYLRGGMGDGGGCHPRDNIALSWLARKLELKFDWFDAVMKQREKQTEWYADLIEKYADKLPVIICGQAFKKNINLTVGSPAILLENILKERNILVDFYDPVVYKGQVLTNEPAVFFIGMNHDVFKDLKFPVGSVVIDPWGIIEDQDRVEVKRLGRTKSQTKSF
jgi:UDPglucose 6-dehydrogenase